jgi:hypothetical protein
MTEQDFSLMNIARINAQMIRDTGAKLEDVQADTIGKLSRLCNLLSLDPVLQHNGLTTGKHASETHPRGQAVDFAFASPVHFESVVKAMLTVGFKGIGVYWNGRIYSYHGDTRPGFAFWVGRKNAAGGWAYDKLLVDPAGKGSAL